MLGLEDLILIPLYIDQQDRDFVDRMLEEINSFGGVVTASGWE